MRKPILLLTCLLLCSCGSAVPEPANVGANQASANSAADAAPADTPVRDPLLVEIDVLVRDFNDLANRVNAATPDELKSGRQGYVGEAEALAEREVSLDKRVADSGDDTVKAHWKETSAKMKGVGRPIGEKLGLRESDNVKALLDIKQLGDLLGALYVIMTDDAKKKRLRDKKGTDKRGREFWEFAFKYKLIDSDLLPKLVSLNSPSDMKSDGAFVGSDGTLEPENCSYTAPITRELLLVMHKKGRDRTVVIAFNSRNWNNYPDKGVLVLWSDGEIPVYMTAEEAGEWGITAEEWADPAGKLFGKKAPFQHTYE